MVKVSVIIPVYNSAPFIRQCVESVTAQTYYELEIILIDDGSTDQSKSICEDLCMEEKRIRCFSQEHKGVSSARNYGLDQAVGTYVFFLDSDDAVHTCLIEKLVQKAEEYQADLAFCTCKRQESAQMDEALNKKLANSTEVQWEVADGTDSAGWFHRKYARELTCMGSKLIRKSTIGTLRFEESLCAGEDTVFMYFLSCMQIRMVYYQADWYYYRMHTESITHGSGREIVETYFKKYDIIRKNEYKRKHFNTAFIWEKRFWGELQDKYAFMKSNGDEEGAQRIREMVLEEMKYPLFRRFSIKLQIYYLFFFFLYPVYSLLKICLEIVSHGKKKRKKYADVGILTFHCADDYGAMLQAYALKSYLCGRAIPTDIIRYEPFFMTGRYWWIPYMPVKGLADVIRLGRRGCKEHRAMEKDFFILRNHMRDFRKKYLVDAGHKKIRYSRQMKRLPHRYFVVGSDQIWNPEITYGFRSVYFGAFKSKRKEKVIAYAASLGGEKLSPDYNEEFSQLLKSVDVVSLREEEAVSYVGKCYKESVISVCDPVFLLERKEWTKIEKIPDKQGYILVYTTQTNQELIDYARQLSKEKGLPVVELRTSTSGPGKNFYVDYEAGPAEFLGYIHKADYVLTNSFHAAAFSLIYQKQFLVFLHRSRGARLRNILSLCGLESRIYQERGNLDIDLEINWYDVGVRIKKCVKDSKEFLEKNLV